MKDLRVYARIDLSAIRENVETIYERAGEGTGIIPVIKANAYGHGAVPVAHALRTLPYVKAFAIAAATEASALRSAGITEKILMLGLAIPSELPELIRQDIIIPVSTLRNAEQISAASAEAGKNAYVAVAVDTGMNRIGFRPDRESVEEIKKIAALPGITLDTLFTHFARADEEDPAPAYKQLAAFKEFKQMLEEEGIRFRLVTSSNSAAGARMCAEGFDAVRLGILLYGLMPSPEMAEWIRGEGLSFRPAMTLCTQIVHIHRIEKGEAVGYGGTYVADGPRTIATIPVGYADGYPRSLSGKGFVLLRGKRVPIAGRVCMDQCMLDVTDLPDASIGDEVVLFGKQGDDEITVEELADTSGRFNYEIPCVLTDRVARIYEN